MKSILSFGAVLALLFHTGCATFTKEEKDPFVWLEEVESPEALKWVQQENFRTLEHFQKNPAYKKIENEVIKIMSNQDRIPYIRFDGKNVYNFWTDDKNPRGILRRTTFENYKTRSPNWEIVLDVDKLNKQENKSWVYRGCTSYKPESETCLLFLSDGGRDATEVREFNLKTKKFIAPPIGFFVPLSKNRVDWADDNSIVVGTDFGGDSMSKSGYPVELRHWKRGTELQGAPIIFKTGKGNMSTFVFNECNPEGCEVFIGESISFYDVRYYWWKGLKEVVKINLPGGFYLEGRHKNEIYISLKKDLKVEGKTFKKGSLLKAPMGDWKKLSEVFVPSEKTVFNGVEFTKSNIYLSTLENVNPVVRRNGEAFPIKQEGQTYISATDRFSDRALISFESPLTPPSLYEWGTKSIKKIKSLPPQFDSSNLKVEQLEAVSADGTKIPYFVIRSKFSRGPGPTMVTAYGGFQIPSTPYYNSIAGKVWLDRGGQYVLANIRGGGEFGPDWHEAALKEKRQNAFNDLYAVTEDLFKKMISTPERTSFVGGSNGGLLAGVAFTQKPEDFGAIVSNVPLLDMLRFHKLLAGHSWVAEYGDPDVRKEREALLKYSPYHNLDPKKKYPPLLLMTSTKDDRVHPGHARKFGAKLKSMNIPFWYYENIEGGHGGAADLRQRARFMALQYTFFLENLGMGEQTGMK